MKRNQLCIGMLLLLFACSKKNDTSPAYPGGSDTSVNSPTCGNITNADVENIAIFPANNPWNSSIGNAAADSRSAAIIALIAGTNNPGIHADFGSGLYDGAPIGIPFVAVCGSQTKLPITYRANNYDGNYGSESDPGPFPIPANAPVEGNGNGGDSHVIAVDVTNKKLYELYNASAVAGGWAASSGAVFDLTSNAVRTEGWTSADAAGLPILPGLVRYDEVLKGVIDHSIRFTINSSKVTNGYTDPARHKVNGGNKNANAPTPMGMRIRLRASFDISAFSTTNRVILTAMKQYGLMLADIGSDMYISGAPDNRWDNDDLHKLSAVRTADFEVIQMGTIK